MIVDQNNGALLAAVPYWAEMPWTRLRGMILRKFSAQLDAMVFPRCRSVHTCFMSMPLDLIFLDPENRIVRCVHSILPWRTAAAPFPAVLTVELPAGTLRQCGVSEGDLLRLN